MVKKEIDLTPEDYLSLEKGRKISCPYSRCRGIVKKIKESEEVYTSYEFSINVYVCDRNSNHRWEKVADLIN